MRERERETFECANSLLYLLKFYLKLFCSVNYTCVNQNVTFNDFCKLSLVSKYYFGNMICKKYIKTNRIALQHPCLENYFINLWNKFSFLCLPSIVKEKKWIKREKV